MKGIALAATAILFLIATDVHAKGRCHGGGGHHIPRSRPKYTFNDPPPQVRHGYVVSKGSITTYEYYPYSLNKKANSRH